MPAPGEGVPAPRGVWSRRVVPASGGMPAPTGVWSWGGGAAPGPHPRGKLRGIRFMPTPKGEIEVDQVQAHTQGGN